MGGRCRIMYRHVSSLSWLLPLCLFLPKCTLCLHLGLQTEKTESALVLPDTGLKLKILELQKYGRAQEGQKTGKNGARDKRQSKFDKFDDQGEEDEIASFFGLKFKNVDQPDDSKHSKENVRHPKVIKKRKKARFPRKSYGYEAPKSSYSAPATSYEAPSIDVSTHRPSYSSRSKSKTEPFTSFRSITPSGSSYPATTSTKSSYYSP